MTKNAWILVNRYCLTFNIYRPFLVDSSDNFSNITCYEKSSFTIQLRLYLAMAAKKNGRRMFCHFPIML